MDQGRHNQLKEITELLIQHISSFYPSSDTRIERTHTLIPCGSLELYEDFRAPSKSFSDNEIPRHTPNLQYKQPLRSSPSPQQSASIKTTQTPIQSSPIGKPKEIIQDKPQEKTQEKRSPEKVSHVPDAAHEEADETEIIAPLWKESDQAVYEKKKREALFPRPYVPLIKEDYYSPTSIQKISVSTGKNFRTSIQYQKEICKSIIPRAWKVVSLFHPTSTPKELHLFLDSIIQAIESKLLIKVGKAIPFQEIRSDAINELSLGDVSTTIFSGEPHQLSSLQSYLEEIDYFQSEIKVGFAPCQHLGKYFDSSFLFLPIDEAFIHNQPAKQELWKLLKRLA